MDKPEVLSYTSADTPIGKIMLSSTNKGIIWVSFDAGPSALLGLRQWGKRWLSCDQVIEEQNPLLEDAIQQLHEYFQGSRTEFSIPLHLVGTPFQQQVWGALRQIPYGEVRSYKDVAQVIGSPKAVRAVGGANNRNPLSIFIPCHRVVGSNGSLVGYGGGLTIKEYLLNLEAEKKEKSNS